MKEKAAQIVILLKQDKSFLPGLFILISFLLTGYLVYPHNPSKTQVAGISLGKATPKISPTATPTPSIFQYKKSQSLVNSTPTITISATANNTVGTEKNASSTDTIQSDSSTAPDDQNILTPTAIPDPTSTPIENTTIPTIIPTTTPTGVANNTVVGNNVDTIIGQVVPLLDLNR